MVLKNLTLAIQQLFISAHSQFFVIFGSFPLQQAKSSGWLFVTTLDLQIEINFILGEPQFVFHFFIKNYLHIKLSLLQKE